ncbi:MAG: MFS transporter [Anaerolineales bacterium]|nr:MFS transporter [Anaerolineales bacterium]
MDLTRWSGAPPDASPAKRRNFLNVQIDAVGVGLASAASPFLPVFLTRLGATAVQVGLLSSLPGITGLVFSIPIGQFLQSRKSIIPWFSAARVMVIAAYALTGLVPLLAPQQYSVLSILAIWALVTLPQAVVGVAFTVVMSGVAGPHGRYALMSRRWAVLGVTTAVTVALVGQVLDHIRFPLNYQVVFLSLSVGGLISYYFSSHIELPGNEAAPRTDRLNLSQLLRQYVDEIRGQPEFLRFTGKRLVYTLGTTIGTPLMPLYLVRTLNASDAWIGIVSTVGTAVVLIGYLFWPQFSRRYGPRLVLLITTLGLSVHPALVAVTDAVPMIAVYAGLAGIFQAGLNLVFFDELMKTVPAARSASFVAAAQSMEYLATLLGPLVGTLVASTIGIEAAFLFSAAFRLAGFVLFLRQGKAAPASPAQPAGAGD